MQELLTMLDTQYKRLEYIQSTGTQYIDTGYVPNPNTEIDTKLKVISWTTIHNVGYGAIFGCRSFNHSSDTFILCRASSNDYSRFETDGSYITNISNLSANTDCLIKIKGNEFICNNSNYEIDMSVIVPNNRHLFLFGINEGGSIETTYGSASTRIYYFKISENGVVIRNFIPVMRKSDNEIGMLDLVEGKFYGNAGTGKFTANLDTMYALIQGTPTVQDGRVSNFSSSNYLKIGQIPTVQNRLERQVKIKTSNIIGSTQTIMSTGGYAGIRINDANQIGTIVYINGSYSNITLNTVLSENTDYIYKDVFENGILTIYLYNYQMVLLETKTTIKGFDDNDHYNLGQSSGRVFTGTIDLNRSYIKIDDTKYKLQAVVGFTVVGNPTITDNVVSGFSSSNYLITSQSAVGNRTEFKTRIIIGDISASSTNNLVFFKMNSYDFALALRKDSKKLAFYRQNAGGWLLGQTVFNNNDIVDIKYIYDGQRLILYSKLSSSADYIKECEFVTSTNTLQGQMYLGRNSSSSGEFFNGSIDMNSTYIKINNKLWFNGLEA